MSSATMLCKATAVLLLMAAAVFTETSAQTEFAVTEERKAEILRAHNALRSEVNPPAANMLRMEYSDDLAARAQVFANRCLFDHSSRSERTQQTPFSSVGENIFAATDPQLDYSFVIETQWGESEKASYDYQTNSCSAVCGHYTQIVWATSAYVGCAATRCDSFAALGNRAATLVFCLYGPGGNVRGRMPYLSGASCSSCPSDKPMCTDNLCSPAIPSTQPPTTEAATTMPTTQAPTTQRTIATTEPTTTRATTPTTQATTLTVATTQATTQRTIATTEPTTMHATTPTTQATTQTVATTQATTQRPATTTQQPVITTETATTSAATTSVATKPTTTMPDIATERPGARTFEVYLGGDSPLIEDDGEVATVTLVVETSQPAERITCYLKGVSEVDCTGGMAVFSGLSMAADRRYLIRVKAVSMEGEVVTIRRRIFISPPSVCTVHFINGGMKVLGSGRVKVEFATRGPADSFFCQMGRGDLVPCSNGEVFSGLSHGSHLVKVLPDPDQCGTPRHSARLRFTLLE